jgi:hypothetical protein
VKRFALLLILSLSACTTLEPKLDRVEATIIIRDEVEYGGLDVCGFAAWIEDQCIIVIKREYYPDCIEHEIRHCFEGQYHD